MGGSKSVKCNELAHKLWVWCMDRSIWLSATHIPGKNNISDHGSRNFNENVEWKLNKSMFNKIISLWGVPQIDMFASRLNTQLPKYISWMPDADAVFVDAFSNDWSTEFLYIFCPFSLIGWALQKIRKDKAECIMVLPSWPTQNWWTSFLELLIDTPYIVPVTPQVLQIPNTQKEHPLVNKLNLVVCRLSGNLFRTNRFQKNLPASLCVHGNKLHRSNTRFTLEGGFTSVIKNKLIQFKLL